MSVFGRLRTLIVIPRLSSLARQSYYRSGVAVSVACYACRSEIPWFQSIDGHASGVSVGPSGLIQCTQFVEHIEEKSIVPVVLACALKEDGDSGLPTSERARNFVRRARNTGIGILDAIDKRWQMENGRVVLQLIGVNIAVFAMWKVLPTSFMLKHFASSLEAMRRGRVWTTLTANFSHMSILHLAANMFLLDQFGRDVAKVLSPERFIALYLSGGLAAVMASLASRRILRNNVLSLGASGSVMAVLFMFANLFPNRSIHIFGIYELPAKDAVVLWALIDAAGMLGSFGKIDFAAHLGGGAFSFVYYNMIREALSREHYERVRKKKMWFDSDETNELTAESSQLRRFIDQVRKE